MAELYDKDGNIIGFVCSAKDVGVSEDDEKVIQEFIEFLRKAGPAPGPTTPKIYRASGRPFGRSGVDDNA